MGLASRMFDGALAVAEELAPGWALRRSEARARLGMLRASGYDQHGASTRKKSLAGWWTTQGGPDADIVENIDTLRERSRDLCMGEGLAIGALRTIRTNEIGAGLRLNAQIDGAFLGLTPEAAQAWEDRVEREFALWADSKACDAARRCTFGELQALARLSQLMSGDVFALLPSIARPGDRYDLKVFLLEADRCCNPENKLPPMGTDLLGGVEVDAFGAPVAYWFTNIHPGDLGTGQLRLVRTREWMRIPAFGEVTGRPLVLHLMESERPGQRRGVPVLAPVMEKLKQLSRYSEAELMAAVVSSYFTAAITSENPETPIGQVVAEADKVNDKDDVQNGTTEAQSMQLGPGILLGLAPGESIQSVNPARPSTAFDGFVRSVLMQVGVGLNIPYHVLIKEFDGSYNASRAALLEFWKNVNVGRAWLAANFCQPVYEAWLEESILRGYLDAPGFFDDPLVRAAWCGAEWIGPTQGQLDPTKEVEAAARRVEEGFSTRTRETRELTGGDWWAFNRLRRREEKARASLVSSSAAPKLPAQPDPAAQAQENA